MKYIRKDNVIKIIILFLILCLIPISTYVNASVKSDLGTTLEDYAKKQDVSSEFTKKADVIIGVLQVVGSLCSVICLIALGIKYMAGSIEEKAEYKKTLLPYCIGAIIVFGISNLLQVVYIVFSELASTI